jgi:phytoene dehydrogenase-like protein
MGKKFDAIVIGSGLGGLTAGALCAKAGLRVLVLERNDAFGGAASIYRHNGLAIETSLHEMDGFDGDDPKLPLIRSLGLDRDLRFVDVGDLYEVLGGPLSTPFVLPHGADAALAAAIVRFPKHTAGLREYFRRLLALRGAVSFAAQHQDDGSWWLLHAPEAVRKLWPLLREGSATLNDVLHELFGDDEAVKLALAANLFLLSRRSECDDVPALCDPAGLLRDRRRPLCARRFAGADRPADRVDQGKRRHA